MTDLPTLKPVEPIAKCGLCNNFIYPHGDCQSGSGSQPDGCPLRGDEWRQMKRLLDMRNSYVRAELKPMPRLRDKEDGGPSW